MTVGLFGLGALIAAAGTRVAGFAFLGAAVLGANGRTLPALVTWTSAMAAGLVFARGAPRRLAIPALGALAAVGAGSARNTAVVLGLWVIATGTAVLSRGKGREADRWAQTLCAADLPVVIAVVWTAFNAGFEGWPQQLDPIGVVLLLLAAVVRAPLISGPDASRPEPGLLAVRTQTIVLLVLAVGSSSGQDLLSAAAVLGVLGFLVGGTASRPATRDGIQELALVAVVLAVGRAGWGPAAWEWGALAAGTLIHNLRLRLESGGTGPLARVLHRGGGLGLPLLPVVLVGLEGATGAGGWVGAVVMLGLVGGLAARATSFPRGDLPASGRVDDHHPVWEPSVVGGIVAGCVIGGLWAPVLTMPEGSAGEGIGWPPLWAAFAVVIAGAGAAVVLRADGRRAWFVPGDGPGDRPGWHPVAVPEMRVPARLADTRLLLASTGVLAVVALGLWVVGLLRGFL